ncbi:MAG: hypothetical protein HC802_01240 [Caldilineaceae bacterium]|nr:hypothetical protein [Caldilineaceae bacterium]
MDLKSLLASVPTSTEAEMTGHRQHARRYTLVLLRKGPGYLTVEAIPWFAVPSDAYAYTNAEKR